MIARRLRGYTVVELMAGLAVFATGVTGVIAMQRATVGSNQVAKNVTVATGIAEAWLGELAADATLWQTTVVGTTNWLTSLNTAGVNGAWQRPTWNATRGMGAEFDPVGAPVATGGSFCAHIRLTWLYRDANGGGLQGNGLVRTETRVFWPRTGVTPVAGDCTAGDAATIANVTSAITRGEYYVVYLASAARQPSGAW